MDSRVLPNSNIIIPECAIKKIVILFFQRNCFQKFQILRANFRAKENGVFLCS